MAGGGAGVDRRAAVEAERAGARGDAARRPPLGRDDLLPMVDVNRRSSRGQKQMRWKMQKKGLERDVGIENVCQSGCQFH